MILDNFSAMNSLSHSRDSEPAASVWIWTSDLMKAQRLSCTWKNGRWTVCVDGMLLAERHIVYEALYAAQLMFRAKSALAH
jgi:hypothetical protein